MLARSFYSPSLLLSVSLQHQEESEKGFRLQDSAQLFAVASDREPNHVASLATGSIRGHWHRHCQVQLSGTAARRAVAHQGHSHPHTGEVQRWLVAWPERQLGRLVPQQLHNRRL